MSDEGTESGLLGALPSGWTAERLGNIGPFLRGGGGSKQDEVDDGFPCVRYGDLYTHHDGRVTDTRSRIDPDRTSAYTALRYGDLLFAGSGETVDDIGRSAVNLMRERAYCGGDVIILRPAIDINSSFLGHAADSAPSRIQKSRMGRGSTVIHIYAEQLRNLVISMPSLEEQRRIAEAIDAVDEAIRGSERVCAKLNALGNALLTHLALQCANSGVPVPLNSTGVWLSGGTPSTSEPSFWDGPIPWITASSLRSKYLSCSSRTLTAAGVSAGSRLVPPGTLICVVRGMSLKSEFRVGIAAVELAFGQDCKALRVTDDWLPEYLHLQLAARESDVLRLVDEASHGTGRLQMQLLGALLVDRVSLGEQQRVLTLYRAHEERVAAEEAGLAKLRQLRAGLAEDLLSGRVRTVAA